jgi:hypothetical protein
MDLRRSVLHRLSPLSPSTITRLPDSQNSPMPFPGNDDGAISGDLTHELFLTTTPATKCEGLDPAGKGFCGLLQLLACDSVLWGNCGGRSCRAMFPMKLFRNWIRELESLGHKNAAFTLKDGPRIAIVGMVVGFKMRGCC